MWYKITCTICCKHDSKSLYSLDYFLLARKRLLSEEELIDLKVLLSDICLRLMSLPQNMLK